MNSPDIKTKEQFIDACRKCGCTEEEIQELLDDRERFYRDHGFYEPWEDEIVPGLGMKVRSYYIDDDGHIADKTVGCDFEELGLTPPKGWE